MFTITQRANAIFKAKLELQPSNFLSVLSSLKVEYTDQGDEEERSSKRQREYGEEGSPGIKKFKEEVS